jgi:hypothetical protein
MGSPLTRSTCDRCGEYFHDCRCNTDDGLVARAEAAERRVAELEEAIIRFLTGLHQNEAIARNELRDALKGNHADR